MKLGSFLICFVSLISCKTERYDIIIRGGTVYDGSGSPPVTADIGINADTIAAVGDLSSAKAGTEITATGLAVAPGFINMLSWSTESLIIDGRSQGEIRQGVTLEVMGEGWSMGPLNPEMKEQNKRLFEKRGIEWTSLGEYLEALENRGISTNVASFVGATTVRIHELGEANRPPSTEELERMKELVRTAMQEGAMGVGSSLIYAPSNYASTEELIELCKVAAEYGGMYITHMRSEGDNIFQAIDETVRIAREAGLPAEIYHLKMAGKNNWWKLDSALAKIDRARADGIRLTTDMYLYIAGGTGLNAVMPPWVQEGGYGEWVKRLKNPAIRRKVLEEMRTPSEKWENLLLASGGADRVLLAGFENDSLKKLIGKTLADVARDYGKSPEETAMDLVIADSSRVGAIYFMMDEENVKRQIALPYMSFGSDAESVAPEGEFLLNNVHPRAYGNFARLLGKYVRDEKVIPLEDAIRKLTSLPAGNLGIRKRGMLKPGYFADVAIFDAAAMKDNATFEKPHQYSTGMVHVFVNGTQVLKDGEHTGAKPGRFVRGPGWKGAEPTP
jgi:N-acyl-D-amino-acid deacylase